MMISNLGINFNMLNFTSELIHYIDSEYLKSKLTACCHADNEDACDSRIYRKRNNTQWKVS